ncbi:MAG: flagellar protein FlaG [Thiobacillus sp.]
MSIGKVDSVDLAALRQAPSPAPVTPAQRATLDNPVFAPPAPTTPEAVAAAVESANAYVQSTSTNLKFSLDKETGQTVVRMVDTETNEVLRQIPSEEMLAISKFIDRMQGLLINRQA